MAKYEEFTVKPELKSYIAKKAKNDAYFQSLLDQVNERGIITGKQMAVVNREQARDKERANRPKLKNEDGELVGVVNQAFRDGKPLCAISSETNKCRNLATIAVGLLGVCEDHVQEGKEREAEWQASHGNRVPVSGAEAAKADAQPEPEAASA